MLICISPVIPLDWLNTEMMNDSMLTVIESLKFDNFNFLPELTNSLIACINEESAYVKKMSLIPRGLFDFLSNINLDLDMQNKKDPLAEYKVNWRISETHGEAQQIGKIDHDAVWICQCCNGYVEKSQVPIC